MQNVSLGAAPTYSNMLPGYKRYFLCTGPKDDKSRVFAVRTVKLLRSGPAQTRFSSSSKRPTGSGAQPASYRMAIEDPLPGVKLSGCEVGHSAPFSVEVKN